MRTTDYQTNTNFYIAMYVLLLHICHKIAYLCINKTRQASRKISSFGRVFAFIEVPLSPIPSLSNGTCELL